MGITHGTKCNRTHRPGTRCVRGIVILEHLHTLGAEFKAHFVEIRRWFASDESGGLRTSAIPFFLGKRYKYYALSFKNGDVGSVYDQCPLRVSRRDRTVPKEVVRKEDGVKLSFAGPSKFLVKDSGGIGRLYFPMQA